MKGCLCACRVFRQVFFVPNKLNLSGTKAEIAIVVEDPDSVSLMNETLHDYGMYIIGRMGIPVRERGVSLISIAIDAPCSVISAVTGKLGKINGVSVKAAYSKV